MSDRAFLIEEDLADDILNYLATRPYKDVAPLIAKLSHMKVVNIEPAPAKDTAPSEAPVEPEVVPPSD